MNRRTFIAGLGGAAAAWPLALRAQQPAIPVIGFLGSAVEKDVPEGIAALRQGLNESGYVEGQNVSILFRWADNQYDRLPSLAADLVRRKVDVIVTTGGNNAALAAKAATTRIPIVFQLGSDPVALNLVTSLSRPGGNVTGVTMLTQTIAAKRLELLHEAVPAATSIAFLLNSTNSETATRIKEMELAARTLGVNLVVLKASGLSEIEAAFAILVQRRVGALLVDSDALFFAQGGQLAALAARHALPAIYHAHDITRAGGLMSYGTNFNDAWRLAGTYAGRILKGEKPSDLPVQQAVKVEMVINLKTAKSLGLTFPLTLLGRADEVIE